jgi:O-succinylbenzoic acid--CoA ligase
MRLRLLQGPDLAGGIASAFDGGAPVAPDPGPGRRAVLAVDEPVAEADALAVVTTSGSTGEPKAVVLGRAAVRASAAATHRRLGGPGEWVCALPTHHVAGFMTLARAVVAGTAARFARADLSDLRPARGRTYLSLVPAQLHRALEEPRQRELLRGYAAVLVGGGAVATALRERAAGAGVAVVATYGMSETCGGCVYDGLPLDGVRVELHDERIDLGGPTAFLGYRLRPDLTAAVLRGDLVRTQDRGRWSGGRLQVLGRIDEVVVSGGENVDLAAAQAACDAEFGPGALALLALPDERWGARIVAVTTSALDLASVQERLGGRLGRAALPRELRRTAAVAYTSTGKIDRPALLRSWEKGDDGDVG